MTLDKALIKVYKISEDRTEDKSNRLQQMLKGEKTNENQYNTIRYDRYTLMLPNSAQANICKSTEYT